MLRAAKQAPPDLLGDQPAPLAPGMGGHQSARALADEWLSPPWLLQALGPFQLDPCAPVKRPWAMAEEHFTIRDNGLTKPWSGRVWLNCPYGAETARWLARMADHNNGIALIFARVETAMWFESVWTKASALLFLRGRLTFYTVKGKAAKFNGGAPSALVAYNESNARCLETCGIAGAFMRAPFGVK